MTSKDPGTTLSIRPLRPEDRDQWQALWRDYLAFYETELPPHIYDSTFARLLGDDPRDFSALVAEADGRLVGLAHFLFHRHGWKQEEVCYLQDLFAVADLRGQGIGRKLIEAVYAEADAAGAPAVYWLTQEFNHTARTLYDRIGVQTPFIKYQRP
ncbi:GNAT family N-acetyltransferase [Cribrihabitans neustonicus]|uniref:GNAT family N-acetyltransferase n=1 Tax=Cribrihabitans neustonicus TaxID=1429085 RepID=UPI003B5AA59A